ncbi:MAG: bifunctional (p)ppGpp synthetase/guanosine-3',5'-bis(diphosphate) 3'-pyrophosphohydrolase [Burkholderiales bacterium]|nr:bifunctional (p)ppGpp synthetase/guanosine-3',5'-bis(diphosphate) 3'-pyrophosphohydrolase [Burkholderiales bacterium]
MRPGSPQLRLAGASAEDHVSEWLGANATHLAESDREALRSALDFALPGYAGRQHASGRPLAAHVLDTAAALAALRLDAETIAAAVLFPCLALAPERSDMLRERFGRSIADLAEGILRMDGLGAIVRPPEGARPEAQAAQLEALRKMLLAMVQDVRVVLVKLADHAQALRHLVRAPEGAARHEAARLAQDIFAPLANRLGVWQLKWEIEDLALRILEPETYQRIARLLDEKRADRERYLENLAALLKAELTRAGIPAEVRARPKHIYSIYQKMRRKGFDFEALYDLRAVRVLVDDVKDCYAVLGHVHNLFSPIPKEFDDYIAKPKSNQYRSLHTAVIGPEGKSVEVQIRTHGMHQHAELGVAAHWRYKEGSRGERGYDEKIAWLRQILEWKDEIGDAGELAERLRTGLFADTIYVLTPQGRVIDLPRGATPIDFAYHVHTELGHCCRGARVDGVMVPLSTPLANGQQVEVIAAKQGGPSRDWLNPALGYVASHGARAKVRQWFNRQNLETAVAQGRAVVEKELQRLGLTSLSHEKLATQLGFGKVSEFLADVGRGEIGSRQLQAAMTGLDTRVALPAPREGAPPGPARPAWPAGSGSILVVGIDRLLTATARCCKPAPPDEIVGFVTRGRGVTIHRAGCPNVKRLDPERVFAAAWGERGEATYPVEVDVHAGERAGIRRDIAEALSRDGGRIVASSSTASDGALRLRYTVEVADLEQLRVALARVREVRGVARAARR